MIGTEKTSSEQFIQLLTVHQPHLLGYILASLGNRTDCDDVLQKTNLVLWKKSAEFRSGAQFLPWAKRAARIPGWEEHPELKDMRDFSSVLEEKMPPVDTSYNL